jgi:glucan biosynthesis protein
MRKAEHRIDSGQKTGSKPTSAAKKLANKRYKALSRARMSNLQKMKVREFDRCRIRAKREEK